MKSRFSVALSLNSILIFIEQINSENLEDQPEKMENVQKFHLLRSFLVLNLLLRTSISQKTDQNFCGRIPIEPPFLSSIPTGSFPLNRMILCRSEKLYFRTSIGLFPISSIDYRTKTLVISHSSSSSIHFVSPKLLTSGFPSAPELTNLLLLFHCSNPRKHTSEFAENCSHFPELGALQKQEEPRTCFVFDDLEKLKSFHPNDMKCSRYRRIYRNSSDFEFGNAYKLGTTISFDIPDHLPNICNECEKPDGHCGVGLRCLCHVLECKDKVFSDGGVINPNGKIVLSLLTVLFMILSI